MKSDSFYTRKFLIDLPLSQPAINVVSDIYIGKLGIVLEMSRTYLASSKYNEIEYIRKVEFKTSAYKNIVPKIKYYFETTKPYYTGGSTSKLIMIEKPLSFTEYCNHMLRQDKTRFTLVKRRLCYPLKNKIWKIDLYERPLNHLGMIEVDIAKAGMESYQMPTPTFTLIRDISSDKNFEPYYLSLRSKSGVVRGDDDYGGYC